jgi:hypothetical protein
MRDFSKKNCHSRLLSPQKIANFLSELGGENSFKYEFPSTFYRGYPEKNCDFFYKKNVVPASRRPKKYKSLQVKF